MWAALEDGGHSIYKIGAQHRSETECFQKMSKSQLLVSLVARYEDEEAHFVSLEPPSQELYMDVSSLRSRHFPGLKGKGSNSILHDKKAISGTKSIGATPPA